MVTHIVARVLVFNFDKQLLVLRRSLDDDYRPGGHDFPGGKVDDDEDIMAGAVRETLEETGLDLDPASLELVAANTKAGYNTSYKTDVNLVRLIYVAQAGQAEVTVSYEHSAHDWLDIDTAIATIDYPEGVKLLKHIRDNEIALALWWR